MADFTFRQADVFAGGPFLGNPVAVVVGADALDSAQMAAIANWTNLSETTFLLRPTAPEADYRVRIFTPQVELPFAGHPTLGSAHVWRACGGVPKGDAILQECDAGLIAVREAGEQFAFAAPPLRRTGPADPDTLARAAAALRLSPAAVLRAEWVDNGPGWLALLLGSRAEVLAIRPDYAALGDLRLGVVGPWDPSRDGDEAQFELRALLADGSGWEDPVTGSLNAGVAQWLIGAGLAPQHYLASQGTVLGRRGRISVEQSGDDIWVGGKVVTRIAGNLSV